ncbi:hypothetical protein ES695_03560 [Candidatus Atribacteria bacterium 1244-E10-H5-B2]|nr:MAG: hypothetical protein ES695_03560 [Candidatus Atribacteria bacterium 1244-E10-H5-B2]
MAESNRNGLGSGECNLLDLQSENEEEISTYLNSLDLADKLLLRDTYYLFCGGSESKQEKAISKIIKTIRMKGGLR